MGSYPKRWRKLRGFDRWLFPYSWHCFLSSSLLHHSPCQEKKGTTAGTTTEGTASVRKEGRYGTSGGPHIRAAANLTNHRQLRASPAKFACPLSLHRQLVKPSVCCQTWHHFAVSIYCLASARRGCGGG